jgi:hypothetical protein
MEQGRVVGGSGALLILIYFRFKLNVSLVASALRAANPAEGVGVPTHSIVRSNIQLYLTNYQTFRLCSEACSEANKRITNIKKTLIKKNYNLKELINIAIANKI